MTIWSTLAISMVIISGFLAWVEPRLVPHTPHYADLSVLSLAAR